jgi:hypothetical protein
MAGLKLCPDEPSYSSKRLAEETSIRYQTLINLYLRECVSSGKKLSSTWAAAQVEQA